VGLLVALVGLPLPVDGQSPPPVEELCARASAYVEGFIATFSGVVAEERFVQETTSLPSVSGSGSNQRMETAIPGRREIHSDVLLVRRSANEDWLVYRDAFEVDGRPVRDRTERLVKLLTEPSVANEELARQVAIESARHTLDAALRSVDNPILALSFLQPALRSHFRYTRGALDRKAGPAVWIVSYREEETPSIVRGPGNSDAPSRGRFWIDHATGRVLKTELQVRGNRIDTTYTWDDMLHIAVPAEMKDSYNVGRTSFRVTATYSRFRRFSVSTAEQVKEPGR
jgi:hypothetical protein